MNVKFIKSIKDNPQMYIGEPSLERLRYFMNGYLVCELNLESGNEQDNMFWTRFQEYIQKHYNINSSQHWTKIISFFSSSDRASFDKFFELLDEFVETEEEKARTK